MVKEFGLECEYSKVEKEVIYSNGTKHIEIRCECCGKFFGHKRSVNNDDFIMPIGKHKGMKLVDIIKNEPEYALWFYENGSGSVQKRFKELMDGTH